MLHSIKLSNFKKHRDLYCEFAPGLNVICGPNWSGKSTLQASIVYALFGARAVDARADQLTTRGEKGLEVRLEFSAGSTRYQVVRSLGTGTLHAWNGEQTAWVVKATGHAAVTAEVEELLGMPAKDFLAFNRIRSRDAAAVLTLGSAKLGEYIDRVSGVDIVDQVLSRLKVEQPKVEGALSALAPLIMDSPDREKLVRELGQAREELTALSAEHARYQQLSADEAAEAARSFAELEVARGQQKLAESSRIAKEGALQALQQAEARLAEEQAKVPVATNTESVESLKLQVDVLQEAQRAGLERTQALSKVDADLEQARQAIAAFDAELENGNFPDAAAIAQCENEHAVAQQSVWETAEQIRTIEETLRTAICPTCQRPLIIDWPEPRSDNLEPAALQAKLRELRTVEPRKRNTLLAAEQALTRVQQAHKRIEELIVGRESWSERHAQLKGERQRLHDHPTAEFDEELFSAISARYLQAVAEADAVSQWERRLDWAKQGAAHAKLALEAVRVVEGPGEAEVAARAARVKEIQDRRETTQRKLHEAAGAIALLEQRIGQQEATLAEQEKRQTDYDRLQTRGVLLGSLAKFLRGNRDRYTASVWENLLGYASEFVAGATAGAVTELRRGESGGFEFVEDGVVREVEGEASDLQEAIFGVAVRLAMGDALGRPFETMLLDEVTAHARDDMALLLVGQLKQLNRQILLVDHRPADGAVADRLIELEN